MNKPIVTIVVTRSYEGFSLVKKCLLSLAEQKKYTIKVLFLDQQKSLGTKAYVESLKATHAVFEYRNIPAKSLSFARNLGLKISDTVYVGFCDLDCIMETNWIEEIIETFLQTQATIVGTKISPLWQGKISWYHKSKFIQEFYSMLDISAERCEMPKVIGASFAVNKTKLGSQGYFDERLGRKEGNYLGGEETDLCKRIIAKGGKIYYTPFTTAFHQVAPYRLKTGWLLKRAYYGGLSRAYRRGKAEPFNKKYSLLDRVAILYILPFYFFGLLKGLIVR